MSALPAWNNQSEYENLESPAFEHDRAEFIQLTAQIQKLNAVAGEQFSINQLWQINKWREAGSILGRNISSFVNCELSLDSQNAVAQKVASGLKRVSADFAAALIPAELYLLRAPEDILLDYLKDPLAAPSEFYWREERRRREFLLTPAEEQLLAQMSPFDKGSWGELYNKIGGAMKIKVGEVETGLAQAQSYLRDSDSKLRESAWHGIQNAWSVHQDAAAAIVNNLAGYRLEEYRKRSRTRKLDFLEMPLAQSKIERQTLEQMLAAIEDSRPLIDRALVAMARVLGKQKLDAWDLLAPAPNQVTKTGERYSFSEATRLITEAFHRITPEMGDFVTMMLKNGWVDSRVLPNKRSGAFCTGFAKSRTPRVFQTFMGSYQDTSTLAHELGHAWHSWMMRDLPIVQSSPPMTLAETASIFAETALADYVFEQADRQTQFEIAFAEVTDAVSLLANITTRFEFEKNFYEARKEGALTVDELGELMEQAFRKWYGEHLATVERQFWMTKLHFSISGISFYNYPYTFGYLFSLGIYNQRHAAGPEFPKIYRDILRDTGRMTAETLVEKHLGADIRGPDFWRQSLRAVEVKIERFEKLLADK